jgi:outer membrane receptor for ferrienterochelin and colicins
MILIFASVKIKQVIFCGLALLVAPLVFAQNADTLATKYLEEVVVTGQYEPQSANRSVYKVRTISMEKIQARGAVRLQDVF